MAILRAHPRTGTNEAQHADFSFAPTVVVDQHGNEMTPTAPLPYAPPPVIATPMAFDVPRPLPADAPLPERARAAVERVRYDAALGWAETRELWAATAHFANEFMPVSRVGPIPVPERLAFDLGRARVTARRAWFTWSYWEWEWPDFAQATALGAIVFALVTGSAAALGVLDPHPEDAAPRVVEQHTAGPDRAPPPVRAPR